MGRYTQGLRLRAMQADVQVARAKPRWFFVGLVAGLTLEYLARHLLRL